MGLELFAIMLASSQLVMYGIVIGKSIRDKTKSVKEDENKVEWLLKLLKLLFVFLFS